MIDETGLVNSKRFVCILKDSVKQITKLHVLWRNYII